MTIKEYEKLWADDVITRMQACRPFWDRIAHKMFVIPDFECLAYWYREFAHLCAENIDILDNVMLLHDPGYGNFLHQMSRIEKEYRKICRLRDETSMKITVWTVPTGEDDAHTTT